MFYHLLRGGEKLTRALIAEDGKVGGECSCVYLSFRGSEYGFKGHARSLHKHAKKSSAIISPSETTGMAHEEANCLPEACEAGMCFLEERCVLGERIWTYQDT